ncbi:NAD(P)H-dependent oxidoreductase [Mesoplasma photuris]|uniref:NAD(P)H-dependent oxidoreductase n=1 Tax=Mesoplasma photuris TaxID=217731 RepID=UPI0004E2574C|nr:NAD(P)H-dependent oxidoreductase [Mesoplasma photuris]
MKKTTILFDHPYDGSLNKEILNRVIKKLKEEGKEYNLVDFHKDNFNPVYSLEELALYSKGETSRDDIKKYQKYLLESDELIMIFPIWWSLMPASTKGFMDLVFKSGFAWEYKNGNLVKKLDCIKSAIIYTTSQRTTKALCEEFGDPVNSILIKSILNQIGIEDCIWKNFEQVSTNTKEDFTNQLNIEFKN